MKNRNFKLEIVYVKNSGENVTSSYDTITHYQGGQAITSYTYNEKVTEKEFGQSTFTFNTVLFVDGVRNPFISLLSIDRKLRLSFDNRVIDFYITAITPTFGNENVSYAYTCQDAFSYELSKICSLISLSTDGEDITDWGGETGPKQIGTLIQKVLDLAYSDWTIDTKMWVYDNNTFWLNNYEQQKIMTISFEEKSISPYNAITSIMKQFDATLYVDYETKQISFWQKELLSYKGLYLRPQTNLSSFSYSDKGDNLYNILHVFGNEDADENYVSILPTMPNSLLSLIPDLAQKRDDIADLQAEHCYFYKMTVGDKTDHFLCVCKNKIIDTSSTARKVESDVEIDENGYLLTQEDLKIARVEKIEATKIGAETKTIYDESGIQENNWEMTSVTVNNNKILIQTGSSGNYEPNPEYAGQFTFNVTYYYYDRVINEKGMEKLDDITYDEFWGEQNIYEEDTTKDLYRNFCKVKYYYFNDSVDTVKSYFKQLRCVPSGISILYDFSYWREQNLLTEDEYEDINKRWAVNFRNINLQYNCYYPQYLTMKYRLDQLEDQLQEFYAELAAEGELYASKEYNAEAYTSKNAFQSYCTTIKTYDEKNGTKKYNGLRIGYYSSTYSTINLGKDVNNNSIVIPDAINIKKLVESYEFTCWYRKAVVDDEGQETGDYEFADVKFSLRGKDEDEKNDVGDELTWYVTEVSVDRLPNTTLYINFDEEKTKTTLFPDDSSTGEESNSAYSVNTASIQGQINDIILSEEYLSLKYAFDGTDWLGSRLTEIKQKHDEKLKKQKTIFASLVSTYGGDWRNYDTNALSIDSTVAYADLVQQYENLSIYVGGIGTREDTSGQYMSFKGRLDHELDVLSSINLNNFTSNASYNNIVAKIDELDKKRKDWWSSWYSNYGWISRESSFEDSDQIDWNGLYSVSWTQFQKIKQPTQSYSLNYIQSDWVEDSDVIVLVGDKVRLQHQYVKDVRDDNKVEIVTSNKVPQGGLALITLWSKGDDTPTTQTIKIDNYKVVNDNHIILNNEKLQQYWDNDQSTVITKLVINNVTYTASGYNRILSIEPVYRNQAIDLRVSGVTHDLRSDVYQLQVEDFTLYKTLVDRLLYLIK